MARSAADLLTALEVLGGPVDWDAKALKWVLPPARGQSLKEFRVGYVLNDPIAPPTPEVEALLEKAIQSLDLAGTKLKPGWPPGVQSAELLDSYRFLLDAYSFSVASPDEQLALRRAFTNSQKPQSTGGTNNWFVGASAALCSFGDWQRQNFRRLEFRSQWQAYFDQVDVFLSPVAFTVAIAHDHSEPQNQRTILTSSGVRPYFDILNWIAAATLTGCPATVCAHRSDKRWIASGDSNHGSLLGGCDAHNFRRLATGRIGRLHSPGRVQDVSPTLTCTIASRRFHALRLSHPLTIAPSSKLHR
jgi:amidase